MISDGKQKFAGGDTMTVKNTPVALGIIGTIITIGGAALMITSSSFAVQEVTQPLGVFFLGVVTSSIAIILRQRQQIKQESQEENDEN